MPGHDIVVIGFSAGGLEPLVTLVRDLPADLPAALFVVHHFPPDAESALAGILRRAGTLVAVEACEGDPIHPGRIYVAMPDRHLVLRNDRRVHLGHGPRENGHRPSMDTLFRSAARTFRSRVIGVLLSGSMDDGVAGLKAIKESGGLALVQDPADALFTGMPERALESVPVDGMAPAARLGAVLREMVARPAPEPPPPTRPPSQSQGGGEIGSPQDPLALERDLGPPSVFTCPECGGALWEVQNGNLARFQCHVGHAYSEAHLVTEHERRLESALAAALRALQERLALTRRAARRALEGGKSVTAALFERRATGIQQEVALLRGLMQQQAGGPEESGQLSGEQT